MIKKKKIIIFTCTGGHNTAAQALFDYLHKEYEVKVLNIFTDVLHAIDLIRLCTFGLSSSESMYHWLLKKRWHFIINNFLLHGNWYFTLLKNQVHTLIKSSIEKDSPDIIFSVIPLFNNYFLSIAEDLNIPFILIPTDIDVSLFFLNMQNPTYKKFFTGLMINSTISQKALQEKGIKYNIVQLGPLLRKSFFTPKHINTLKNKFNIEQSKKVILLMMGSQGSNSLYECCRELSKISTPIHLIIVLGKNIKLVEQIKSIYFPAHISTSIVGFSNQIASFMTVADLLVTKSGGMSVMEGLNMHLPMILDATKEVIIWEKKNQQFILENNLGIALHKYQELPNIIDTMLNKEEYHKYKDSFSRLVLHNAPSKINALVKSFLNHS